MWGRFETVTASGAPEWHVLPVAEDSEPAGGHQVDLDCWCEPSVLPESFAWEGLLWTHHDPFWPGSLEREAAGIDD